MKSKTPLVMMEQIVMVLIFALAAALCLQTFVLSGKMSKENELVNRAAIEAQNTAESMKAYGIVACITEAEQIKDGYRFYYDSKWNKTMSAKTAEFYLDICPSNHDNEYFWKAEIIVKEQDGTELFTIPVAGQKEVLLYE